MINILKIDLGDTVVLKDGTTGVIIGMNNQEIQIGVDGIPIWIRREDIKGVNVR